MSLLSTLEFISTSPLSALECTRTSPLSGYDGVYALLLLGPHMGLASTRPPCAPDAPSPNRWFHRRYLIGVESQEVL
ncbi:hypothetical protein B0H16DRAFT_1560169 [Mycena metata]|uniref:Uncharacterized protein n=1 Tax=Mycena metata TaxID=1033252 RepID=A0AAD7IIV5_9AGAR|nr:hypothetical protein B0H16DRAFT_1560169 [Mycena metata]